MKLDGLKPVPGSLDLAVAWLRTSKAFEGPRINTPLVGVVLFGGDDVDDIRSALRWSSYHRRKAWSR